MTFNTLDSEEFFCTLLPEYTEHRPLVQHRDSAFRRAERQSERGKRPKTPLTAGTKRRKKVFLGGLAEL